MHPVYLDYAATAPLRPEVLDAMLPLLGGDHGNPSSVHAWGRRARAALDEARERFAAVIGAHPAEIVFTRGGTEADNLAVFGRARARPGAPLACSAIEHRAVLEAVRAAGGPAHLLPVGPDGVVDPDALDTVLAGRPAVVSMMWANNETGAVQPVEQFAARCAEAGVVFHADAVQALGKLSVRVKQVPAHLLAFSAHKVGGPRGVGALFVRRGTELAPLLYGGAQERGLRPGTEDVAGAMGFAIAAELAETERAAESVRLTGLRDRLEAALRAAIPELVVHAAPAPRLPNVASVALPGAGQEMLLLGLDLEGVAVSSGSACSSGAVRPSHVLEAMGVAPETAAGTVRFSLGAATSAADIDRAVAAFLAVAERIRALA